MKVELGAKQYLYPKPVVLVGANINGKTNYTPVSHTGLMGNRISVFLLTTSYTNKGIKETGTFSVNLPSQDQLVLVDYCGQNVSGKDTDKGTLFKNFYGKLKTAPMIMECPLNFECRVVETTVGVKPVGDVFIGEIVEAYCNDEVLTDGKFDLLKARPFFVSAMDLFYYSLGDRIASCGIGDKLKK